MESIESCESAPVAVFMPLVWKGDGFEEIHYIEKKKLTPKEFFIGNPGVQGSNMCIRLDILLGINGFDESLPSTTDRDLMIRFLDYLDEFYANEPKKAKIIVTNEPLVVHHAYGMDRVTDDTEKKKKGLDLFYNKYRQRFSHEDWEKSLERASRLFGYEPARGKIVIGMALKNGARFVKRAVESVLNQKGLKRDIILLIVNDGSTDNWKEVLAERFSDSRIIFQNVNLGSSFAVRNFILDYARNNIQNVDYIGRLDADDQLVNDMTLCKIEEIMDKESPDVIIAGNLQSKGGKIKEWVNVADKKLLTDEYVKERLYLMSKGIPEGELPSCNIFIKPSVNIAFRNKVSAEDHWFTVDLLLNRNKLKIHVADDLLYAIYSLDGVTTKINKNRGAYLQSRIELYKYFLSEIEKRGMK